MPFPDLGAMSPSRIGRYFDVVALIPSSLLVTYFFVLVSSGAWDGSPDWLKAGRNLAGVGLGGVAGLALLSLVLALLLHPLQYGMTQFLEGYWGDRPLAQRLMVARMLHHMRRSEILADKEQSSDAALALARRAKGTDLPHLALRMEARRLNCYPEDRGNVMPTRLGNILRLYEVEAGAQYGLPVVAIAAHLTLVAEPTHTAYIDDQRTQMDLAIRLTWLSGVAFAVSIAFLWRSGPWLLLAGFPYAAMYLFYRGAVGVAAEYGTAISTALDLNRFTLYNRLHVGIPTNSKVERERNKKLISLLSHKHETLDYVLDSDLAATSTNLSPDRAPDELSME
jgi:hypothetical protein